MISKVLVSCVVITVFAFLQPAGIAVAASTASAAPTVNPEVLVNSWVGMPVTEKNILLVYALAGATAEELVTIREDLRTVSFTGIKIDFKENELLVNGEKTGLVFASYSPLEIRMNNKRWSYDKSKPVGANYLSWKKFVTENWKTKKTAGFWMFTPAIAQTKGNVVADHIFGGLLMGAGIGILAGGLLPGAVFGGAIGVAIGLFYGLYEAHYGAKTGIRRSDLVDVILKDDIRISCTEKELKIQPVKGANPRLMVTSKPSGAPSVRLFDMNGQDTSVSVTAHQKSLLAALQRKCKSEKDAAELTLALRNASQSVLTANNKPSKSVPPEKGVQ